MSTTTSMKKHSVDEQSPLLQTEHESYNDGSPRTQKATPLPKVQLSVILLLQLAEPISAMCIRPFVNHLVSELNITGGDSRKVGYYAGMIESFFFLAQAMCVLQWSRISDQIGRKPVLLIGLGGLSMSMILFGFSKSFFTLLLSRSLAGMLNGNIGVIKCMMAEITDSTNLARAFSFMPIVWAIGVTIGPFAGGILSRPYERFPSTFHHLFWKEHPYLLSCLFAAFFALFALVISLIFLNETVDKRASKSSTDIIPEDLPKIKPTPLRDIMTRPVLLSVINYCILAFLDISFGALQPLFYSTEISLGGLGLDPPAIGTCLGLFGITNGVLQGIFFPIIVRRIGPQRVFLMGMAAFPAIFLLFPVINYLARSWGLSAAVWAAVAIQLFLVIIMDMAYGAIFIFVTTSVPSRQSLGSVNGMAQTTVSIARALGPAASTSFFALSLEKNWLGGNAVYLVFITLSALGLSLAVRLPRQAWSINS